MSVQDPTDETVTTDEAQIDDVVLERRSWNYGYIGEDADGRHHHVDRKRDRIVVTKTRADRDDSGAVPVFSLEGPILHSEGIVLASNGAGGDDLRRWIAFVDQEIGDEDDESGWAERPVSAADEAQDVLEEVL
ncbi:hypothetical protein NP511_02195 [Natrinema thermotolerans]|uniref:Uncharacterized protein n=1 Tax=Natrinema thermotolerans TaxID=121872 RepID=A0AAF0PAE1_9EURY|nr:hypothetical protein [Natrinema thermotolerans]WPH65870.1 hypothetical protein HJTV4_gp48 [Haloarchaeal virus HJTV-4]QCC60775.1 hypothetical protein DVR14_19885 [Natrinema thermotolerans]QCC61655.1 hypothetical protein DVR14_24025 [Natrinema thermotolerans]WMT07821.1 hypothetical protein NP511_20910 [Natrinema thermotolerans]WMT08453.1 hypothetical protein NP511_02195 [Natrinema thermotolerans]